MTALTWEAPWTLSVDESISDKTFMNPANFGWENST